MFDYFGIPVDLTQGSAIVRVSHDEKYVVDRLGFETSVIGVTSREEFLSLVRILAGATVAAADVTAYRSGETTGAPSNVAGDHEPGYRRSTPRDDGVESADPEDAGDGKF